MNRNTIIVSVIILLVLLSGTFLFVKNQQDQQAKQAQEQKIKIQQEAAIKMQQEKAAIEAARQELMARQTIIQLSPVKTSSESGTATLTDENGKLKVTISLVGFQPNGKQPAHIHVGKCPGVGGVKYPLTSIENGVSETILDTTRAALTKLAPLAINVHKSQAQISIYTSCGDIPAPTPTSTKE